MKPSTIIWVGIRHVGRKSESDIIESGNVMECLKVVGKFMMGVDMATRVEIYICRNESDLQQALATKGQRKTTQVMEDTIDEMFKDLILEFESLPEQES